MTDVLSPALPVRWVAPAPALRGVVRVAPDKSITHRALLLAGAAEGESTIRAASDAEDPRSTVACLQALGVSVEREQDGSTPAAVTWTLRSPGLAAWREPAAILPCGNSGTTLRLLAGLLAGISFTSTLDGDESLRNRPVARVVEPLRRMGAAVHARDGDRLPPLTVTGRRPLRAIKHVPSVPSAQVKSAVLLAGLSADGHTTVREAVATRDHTERMLRARGVEITSEPAPDGWRVTLAGPASVRPRSEAIPGDVSAAMFWLVAAAIHPDADLVLEAVGVNPTRSRAIDLLRSMGAAIEVTPARDLDPPGEPMATLRARSGRLEGVRVPAEDVARSIDEIPALAIAAAFARGTSRFEGVDELRRKESDRVAGVVAALDALGVRCEVDGDALEVHGAGQPLRGLAEGEALATLRDHRLVMAFAVAGLATRQGVAVTFPDAASVSYPGFFEDLERVRT